MDCDFDQCFTFVFENAPRYQVLWARTKFKQYDGLARRIIEQKIRAKVHREIALTCKRFGEKIVEFKDLAYFISDPASWCICPPDTILYCSDEINEHENIRQHLRKVVTFEDGDFLRHIPLVLKRIRGFMRDYDNYFINEKIAERSGENDLSALFTSLHMIKN